LEPGSQRFFLPNLPSSALAEEGFLLNVKRSLMDKLRRPSVPCCALLSPDQLIDKLPLPEQAGSRR
jgi:hypothetical protein